MSSKCAVCDQRGASFYYDKTDDMYHMLCWYETYQSDAFLSGYDAAEEDHAASDYEDIDIALMLFDVDPPDSATQFGYMKYLMERSYDND